MSQSFSFCDRVVGAHQCLLGEAENEQDIPENALRYRFPIVPRTSTLMHFYSARRCIFSPALTGRQATGRLGYWLRGLGITDCQISPAHSWRHWFIDACRAAQLHPEIRSALTGHSARRDKSANYGVGMGFIQLLAENIGKVRPPLPPVTTKAAA